MKAHQTVQTLYFLCSTEGLDRPVLPSALVQYHISLLHQVSLQKLANQQTEASGMPHILKFTESICP